MITNINEFMDLQSQMFSALDEYLPQMEKIEKANEVCTKLLEHIDSSIENFDEKAFDEIDIDEISERLNIKKNKEIDKECLMEIYKEVENSYALGGRVSLTEYLLQGNLIYLGMQNELMGSIDYSINYSEEELKKREKEAFEKFGMISAMQFLVENKDTLLVSGEGQVVLERNEQYLNKIIKYPELETIEDKLLDLNYSLLALEELNSLGCDLNSSIYLNRAISNKFKEIVVDIPQYTEDARVSSMYTDLVKTIENLCDKDSVFSPIYQESMRKIMIINDSIENINENVNENVDSLQK